MKILSLFNNKGGVGKTTLAFHLACALAELDNKVLMVDLDPQCNLTLFGTEEEKLHSIWAEEDDFIDGYDDTKKNVSDKYYREVLGKSRTIHFILKPTEEGTGEMEQLPPPLSVRQNLDMIPGRLTVHMFENKISERWSGVYQGDALSIRTITSIRKKISEYAAAYGYDYAIIDTSPSLSALNKVIISTADCFIVPCLPDMFSLYGIRNIGNSLENWKKEFVTFKSLLSDAKLKHFPDDFVRFLGFTIYNAKKYTGTTPYDLAKAHYNYAEQIPETIFKYIPEYIRNTVPNRIMRQPVGGMAVMHTHNTLPNMAQKYRCPIWDVPNCNLEPEDSYTITPNRRVYTATSDNYKSFATDLLSRLERL